MKIWSQVEKDVFSYYDWFCKDKALKILGKVPNLSVFSVNGTMIFGLDDRRTFIERCSNQIKEIFLEDKLLGEYKFYLQANIELKDKNSKMGKYKKVWKSLQTEWPLDGFRKGPEVEVNLGETLFFTSIAEFNAESLPVALEMLSKNSHRLTIIASKKSNLLDEFSIKKLFNAAFGKCDLRKNYEINYSNLFLNICTAGDIVFRWGDSSEEAEVALVFKENLLEFFYLSGKQG